MNGKNDHEVMGTRPPSEEESLRFEWAHVSSVLLRLAHWRLTCEARAISYGTEELAQDTCERLIRQRAPFVGAEHVCATARIMMDRLLIDRSRRKQRMKRQVVLSPLQDDEVAVDSPRVRIAGDEVAAMVTVLERLRAMDERQARVVELRFLEGMSASATAEALGVTRRTVDRDWVHARSWLRRELSELATDLGVAAGVVELSPTRS
jgi:RNA polymerase sigma factor (TIGR02999 family)